ncbi:alpha/beta fold hydrolase [Marinomonas posidonica]|uniref:alpha/beta fold hydrolase n=1 Tax=Marinomonas posidonica TaxID=936476 RepID=UPI003736051F
MKAFFNMFAFLRLMTFVSLAGLLLACEQSTDVEKNANLTQQVTNNPEGVQNHLLYMEGPSGDFKLHYASSDRTLTPRDTLVFIHDTGEDSSSFRRYFQADNVKQKYRLIALDRPGWGKSTYAGDFPSRLEMQSEMLAPVIQNIWERNGKEKILLAGQGYGGALASLLAAEHPNFVRGVVLINATLSEQQTQAAWYASALKWLPSFFFSQSWQHAQLEQVDLASSLHQAKVQFAGLTQPIGWLQTVEAESAHPGTCMRLAKDLFQQADIHLTLIEKADNKGQQQYPEQVMRSVQAINIHSRL